MSVVYSRLNKALGACEAAIANPADWYDACSRVSNVLTSMGRFDEASQWNTMALDTTPRLVPYHHKAAILYTIQEDWDQAIASYHQVLELEPQSAEAHRSLARLHSHLEQLELELHHWDEFLRLRPELSTPENNYKLGQSFQEQGHLDRAALCYERVIEKNDQYWKAYYDLAEVRSKQQQWDKVVSCYEQVLSKDDSQVLALHKLGKIWLQQKEYDQAIANFREATKLAPEFPWAYLGLVETFMELEQWDEAIATCRAIISFVDEFPWTYKHMGKAFINKGEKMKAIACYQKSLQLQGWEECVQKDYQFTQDNFSHQIPIWENHLKHLSNQERINVLEIGTDQGITTCWLLDNILTNESSKLMCIDRKFSSEFNANIRQSGVDDRKFQKLKGNIRPLLKSLKGKAYNLVVVQDPLKQAKLMKQDARLSWPLVKGGGIVVFPSYGWKHKDIEKSPKVGISQFLSSIEGQFEIIHQGYQLIIRKNYSE